MQINNTDIRTFNAKQLKVSYTPPSTAVSVELFDGALTPSESETYTPLSELTVEIYFRGQTRNEIQRYVSNFNAMLQKGVILTLDGYERKFKAYMKGNTLNKTITGTRYKAEFTFTGYWFSDTVTLAWQEVHEAKFEVSREQVVTVQTEHHGTGIHRGVENQRFLRRVDNQCYSERSDSRD